MSRSTVAMLASFTAAAMLAAGAAQADLPSPARGADCPLAEVGRGRLTFLGMGIYRASLWTDSGRYGAGTARCAALSLWYERGFTRAKLIEITTGEWKRLALASPAQIDTWRSSLEGFWVDVAPGDNMTAVVFGGGPTRFYDRDGLLGTIDDPAFGPAYLAIWVDPRTRVAKLRNALLATTRS